jgi:CPA2 family monovalent cation:H+ antiporter-2
MALTPLLAIIGQKLADRIEQDMGRTPVQIIEYGARDLVNHVIIVGFGKIGKTVAKVLEAEGVNYIALDLNDDIVREEIANGLPVFRGDISQQGTMEAVGARRALALILTINNEITLKKSIKAVRSAFNHLEIIVRTEDLKNCTELYDFGANSVIPQDYEMGLQLGSSALKAVGVSDYEINRIKAQFRAGNYNLIKKDDTLLETEEDDV